MTNGEREMVFPMPPLQRPWADTVQMGPSDMVTPRERIEGFSAKIRALTANVNELRR